MFCDLNENQIEAEGGKKIKYLSVDLPLIPVISTSSLRKSVLHWVVGSELLHSSCQSIVSMRCKYSLQRY